MLVAAEKEINGKPTVLQCIVGFFVDSAWEMKFFFIFRVEFIFYCYICPQKSQETHFNDVYGHHSSWYATQRHDDY